MKPLLLALVALALSACSGPDARLHALVAAVFQLPDTWASSSAAEETALSTRFPSNLSEGQLDEDLARMVLAHPDCVRVHKIDASHMGERWTAVEIYTPYSYRGIDWERAFSVIFHFDTGGAFKQVTTAWRSGAAEKKDGGRTSGQSATAGKRPPSNHSPRPAVAHP